MSQYLINLHLSNTRYRGGGCILMLHTLSSTIPLYCKHISREAFNLVFNTT